MDLPADSKIHNVFDVSKLKPHSDPDMYHRKSNPFPKTLEGEEVYEIERIIDHDFKFGTQWYKVAWKGYSEVYDSTWEPREELIKGASKLVSQYEKENDIQVDAPQRRKPKRRR